MKRVLIACTAMLMAVSVGTAATADIDDLEAFLGLTAGTFDQSDIDHLPDFTGPSAEHSSFDGSAIKQTITVSAGDELSFDWSMLTDEDTGTEPGPPDYAFVSISGPGVDELGVLEYVHNGPFSPSGTPFADETGYVNERYTFTAAGVYTIGFGAVNIGDGDVATGILVDNVHFSIGSGTIDNGGFETGDLSDWTFFDNGDNPYFVEDSAFGASPTEGTYQGLIHTQSAPPVPEPGTMALLGLAGAGIFLKRRQQRKS